MNINIREIALTIIFAVLAYYANSKINTVPVLRNVVEVIIVVVAVIFLVQGLGLISGMNTHLTVH